MLFLFFLLELFVRSIHYFYICLFLFDFLNLYILCFIGVHTYLQYIGGFLSLCFCLHFICPRLSIQAREAHVSESLHNLVHGFMNFMKHQVFERAILTSSWS